MPESSAPKPLTPLERAIFDAHKRAHGLSPEDDAWYDERWLEGGAWFFDAKAFVAVLGMEFADFSVKGTPMYRIRGIPR
jgi:hypothetical protein